MILDIAKQYTATLVAGGSLAIPMYMMIGSGSGSTTSNMTALIYPTDRQPVTSLDNSTVKKISYQGDWNSVEISGLSLTEFGMIGSGNALTGSQWSRQSIPAITFDGTNELQIQETWEIY